MLLTDKHTETNQQRQNITFLGEVTVAFTSYVHMTTDTPIKLHLHAWMHTL